MQAMKIFLWALCFLAAAAPVGAFPREVQVLGQSLQPGGYWLAEVPSTARVMLGGTALLVVASPSGTAYVLAGFDRFSALERWVKVCLNDTEASCSSHKLVLAPRTYATQNVRGAPKNTLKPNAAETKRNAADGKAIGAARAEVMAQRVAYPHFAQGFVVPVKNARISGVYGSRRLFEGEERSWHKGLDYAAPTGTPVYAPAAGVVRLARDTFMSGNLIMLDHGGQLSSVYAHLNKMHVKVGEVVKQGQHIGDVGTTGRSSGPHLHWGMYWGTTAIDPLPWVTK
jgi:murein DD-endopeptidase MepM/ murein hydrolase activator NlpD